MLSAQYCYLRHWWRSLACSRAYFCSYFKAHTLSQVLLTLTLPRWPFGDMPVLSKPEMTRASCQITLATAGYWTGFGSQDSKSPQKITSCRHLCPDRSLGAEMPEAHLKAYPGLNRTILWVLFLMFNHNLYYCRFWSLPFSSLHGHITAAGPISSLSPIQSR